MPQPQFIPSPLKIIERRRCQNCGATLIMTGIEPIGLGIDRRTFECDQCGHEEQLLVNSRAAGFSCRFWPPNGERKASSDWFPSWDRP